MSKFLILVTLIFFSATSWAGTTKNLLVPIDKWDSLTYPTSNSPRVYGSYSAGCLDGAQALEAKGDGYELVRMERARFYGHPTLIEFIKDYARQIKALGKTLYISDAAQPRGGPTAYGSEHASHQTGLDVDIWFDSKNDQPISLLNKDKSAIDKANWQAFNINILKLATSYNSVERIFVNPLIKQQMCQQYKGQSWMAKIRPWWGHYNHFHVRLKCPEGSPDCKAQNEVAATDGCDSSLAWWFSQDAIDSLTKSKRAGPILPVLPQQCLAVLNWKR